MSQQSSTNPYQLGDIILLLRDTSDDVMYDLDFHLEHNDYLGLVAGALGMFIDDYELKDDADSQYKTILLKKIQSDLAKLHQTHTIALRDTNA